MALGQSLLVARFSMPRLLVVEAEVEVGQGDLQGLCAVAAVAGLAAFLFIVMAVFRS